MYESVRQGFRLVLLIGLACCSCAVGPRTALKRAQAEVARQQARLDAAKRDLRSAEERVRQAQKDVPRQQQNLDRINQALGRDRRRLERLQSDLRKLIKSGGEFAEPEARETWKENVLMLNDRCNELSQKLRQQEKARTEAEVALLAAKRAGE